MPNEKESNIFIDTDAFVALIDKNDPNHGKAREINAYLEESKAIVYTSNFVFGEAVTVISQNVSHDMATVFGNKIVQSEINLIDANRQHRLNAFDRFTSAKSKNVRFTDYINMVLMDELNIKHIFSFDKHYKQEGYKRLLID